ncbi:MAG: hypothetical protein PVS3B2_07420 [Candidatus Dormibacteraceae bacterium]
MIDPMTDPHPSLPEQLPAILMRLELPGKAQATSVEMNPHGRPVDGMRLVDVPGED